MAASINDADTTLRLSPPATTSPSSSPSRPVADRVATPLSLFRDSPSAPTGRSSSKLPARGALARADLFATMSPAETPEPAVDSETCLGPHHHQERRHRRVAPAQMPGPTADQGPYASASTVLTCQNEPPSLTNTTPPPDRRPRSPLLSDARPLRTASVRADTRIAHPRPIACAASVSQPVSDLKIRPRSPLGNIAQLEATAERLSMTSSIDDAIRQLHSELKRNDSRRSSILAAGVRASSTDVCNNSNNGEAAAAVEQLMRHLSATTSIVSTNIAARHGGYSPAAYVMSPSHSLTGRLRSGSKASVGRPDADVDTALSRHGPGNTSVRSARSTRISLAEISESEPVSLTQDAFDEADAAPPIEQHMDQGTLGLPQHDNEDVPSTDSFYHMLDAGLDSAPLRAATAEEAASEPAGDENDEQRPTSSRSNTTLQQCQDAFIDFDGVHWEPEHEEDLFAPPEMEPRAAPSGMARPRSYLDAQTGQQMLYYPARVPAMLNLPPKLSNRPKAAQRNQRRSQILSAMMDINGRPASSDAKRHSLFPDLSRQSVVPPVAEQSWLPDPVAGHRDSFAALSQYGPLQDPDVKPNQGGEAEPAADAGAEPEVASNAPLRRPPRLSAMDPEKRKSKALFSSKLPPQLRASAFFELPPITAGLEIKDGSAMATLDSILDASATAPVNVFTDHAFAGQLGSEVYGKKKKSKARKSTATLNAPSAEPEQLRKRPSLMWLSKRSSYNSEETKRPRSMASAAVQGADGEFVGADGRISPSGSSEENATRVEAVDAKSEDDDDDDDDDSDEEESYHGPPTTLLAELQLRKKEQQQRKKNFGGGFPNGMHATLLEMDTVAETQRKHRQSKRVNLAWEEPDAHVDQNGSDDEDVPLAILAAMQQGAKNRADLERPMGLMQRRELEDNEPLSRRRARLQGLDPTPVLLPKRQSVMSFPALQAVDGRPLHPTTTPSPGLEDEVDGETLGERRRRLAAVDGGEGELPRARPVSSSFSAELLSQFGDLEPSTPKEKPTSRKESVTAANGGEEETLGQRRRRLQAEREAREREMGHGNLTGEAAQRTGRRLSMADVLAAHPKKDGDTRAQEERRRADEEKRAATEREAKLAAMRNSIPQSLDRPNIERAGGFRGGAYNDGTGGSALLAARSSPALNTLGLAPGLCGSHNSRSSIVLDGNYGGRPAQRPMYGASMSNLGAMNSMGPYSGMNTMGLYHGSSAMSMYGGGMMAPGMPMAMPTSTGSMDRVEQWRRGVRP